MSKTLLKQILIKVFIVLILVLILAVIFISGKRSGRDQKSRQYLLQKECPGAVICTEEMFGTEKETNILHGFLTQEGIYGLASFKHKESGGYELEKYIISKGEDILTLETKLGKIEYYVFAIDEKKIHTAHLQFIYSDGTSYDTIFPVSGREMFVILKPKKPHEVVITYHTRGNNE